MLGSAFLYFNSSDEEKIRSVLLFASVYILLALVLLVVKRIFFKKKKKESEQYPLPETDERIEKMGLKLMAQIFGLSHLIGSAILFVLYITNENSTIRVRVCPVLLVWNSFLHNDVRLENCEEIR